MADDFSANARTTGTVAVGGSATGEIGKKNDVDWFAVELVAGRTYVIDLEGAPTGSGTLGDAMLRGLYDAGGNRIAGTRDHDGGEGANARLTFTATESGTHYIAARSQGGDTGSYTVRVTAFDADATAAGATDLGDFAALDRTRTQQDTVDGGADGTDYYRFTLSEARTVQLTLRRQDADADLYLEDADGTVLHSSTRGGTRNDRIDELLEAGTYYVRVVAQEEGENAYSLRYRVTAPEPDPQLEPDPQPQQNQPPQPVVVPTNVPEPEGQDFSSDTSTLGRIAVGGSVTGHVGGNGWSARDDWFAVELKAGKNYGIDLKGAPTGDGTLRDPMIRGIFDAGGNAIASTFNDQGGEGANARTLFTPGADGTYYVAASGYGPEGTYTLSVAEIVDRFTADTGTSGTVEVGGSATGEIGHAGDRDWFAVTLEAGKTYRVDLKGAAYGDGTLRDPEISGIYDADGNVVANTSNNIEGVGRLNALSFITPGQAGTYYVAASGTGTGTGTYTLSVTDGPVDDFTSNAATTGKVAVGGSVTGEIGAPDDRDWFAVSLEKGKLYRFDLKGTPASDGTSLVAPVLRGIHDADGNRITGTTDDGSYGGPNRQVWFAAPETAVYYVSAAGHDIFMNAYRTGTYTLSVVEVPDDFLANADTSGTVEVGGSATGEIGHAGDRDWFAVTLKAGRAYRIDLEGAPTEAGTLRNPWLGGIYDANGNHIAGTARDDGGDGANSRKFFAAAADGTYYVAAGGHGTGTYTLSVTDAGRPELAGEDLPANTLTHGEVAVGSSVTGRIDTREDVDWYAVTFEKGKTYRIDMEGLWNSDGPWTGGHDWLYSPYLKGVYDSNGNFFTGTWDINGGRENDSLTLFTAPETGTYYVGAGTGADWWIKPDGKYSLSVREYALGGTAGSGPGPLTGIRESVSEPKREDFDESPSTRGRLAVGDTVKGRVNHELDIDWFAVELEAGKTYQFDSASGVARGVYRGQADFPSLHGIYDADGTIYPNTTSYSNPPRMHFTAPETGTYYVAAGTTSDEDRGAYWVSVIEYADDDFTADTATDGTVEVNGSATGEVVLRYDRDWFAVELEAGRTYQIDLRGSLTHDGTLDNPALYGIHDKDGNLIAGTANDDTHLPAGDHIPNRNSRVFFTPDEDGTYYVSAGNSSTANFVYGQRAGTYTMFVTDTSTDDFAADTGTDGAVAVGGSATGRVETPDDRDWFAVTLEEGKTYRFDLAGSSAAGYALRDPMLYGIHDADGTLIAGTADDDGGEGTSSRVEFTASESGTYYVSAGADGVNPEIRPGYYWWAKGEPDAAARAFGRDGVESVKLDNLGGYALSVEEVVDAM